MSAVFAGSRAVVGVVLGLASMAGIAFVGIVGLLFLIILDANTASSSDGGQSLAVAKLPAAAQPYVGWVMRAGGTCPELGITAPVIAAQIQAESNWDPNARSKVGALGLSQFMPGTWATYGKDFDGDGDARQSDPEDNIMAQAEYDCALARTVSGWKNPPNPKVSGETLDLTLAAYNAGPGAVERYGGVPPYAETTTYIERIKQLMVTYTALDNTAAGQLVVAKAMTVLGYRYVWGGDCSSPDVGCDCSGLVVFAWRAAGVNLPRTTGEQAVADDVSVEISLDALQEPVARLQKGDLILTPGSDGTRTEPGHVSMYIGLYDFDGQGPQQPEPAVVVAPQSGDVVKINRLSVYSQSRDPVNQVVKIRRPMLQTEPAGK